MGKIPLLGEAHDIGDEGVGLLEGASNQRRKIGP
jgi:hypothetical protein